MQTNCDILILSLCEDRPEMLKVVERSSSLDNGVVSNFLVQNTLGDDIV